MLETLFDEEVFGPDRTTLLRHKLRGQSSRVHTPSFELANDVRFWAAAGEERSITADRLIGELDHIAAERGYPAVLRCDNGPELACSAMADWAVNVSGRR